MNIRKLKSGNWNARVYLGMKDGKKQYYSVTAATKKRAELLALQYQPTFSNNLTFLEASERYLNAKSNTLSPNTIRSYRILLNRLTDLYKIPLIKLDNERVQLVINKLSYNLSPKSVKSTYGFITAVLSMFAPDIKLTISLPEKIASETKIPTKEEVKLLIEEAASEEMSLAIQLAAFGSLRSGEICGLKSDCIYKDHIRIKRSLALNENGKYVIKKSPKTYAGFRDVPLPDEIIIKLKALVKPDGSVFHYTPNSLNSAFRRLTKHCKMYPYKFHALRHYFASFCHAKGIPDQYIMQIGGWDDVNTLTKIYQHTMDDEMENTINKILSFYQEME